MGGSVNPYGTPIAIPLALPVAHSATPVGQHAVRPQAAVPTSPVGQHPTAPQGQAYYNQRMQEIQAAKLAEALRQQQAKAWETQQAQQEAEAQNINGLSWFG